MKNAVDYYNRPLFEEPGLQCEREDEWSYPKGFALGGMFDLAAQDLSCYAARYFETAEAVIKLVTRNDIADYTASSPVLYLYRHAVELYLKAAILHQGKPLPKNEHSLHRLANAVDGLEEWALKRIQELNDIDPQSTILRYGSINRSVDEVWTEVTFLCEAMRRLRDYLKKITDGATGG